MKSLEEEIDILDYSYSCIDSIVSMLKECDSEDYKVPILQAQELLNEIDNLLLNKEDELDDYDEQQLIDSRIERYKKEQKIEEF